MPGDLAEVSIAGAVIASLARLLMLFAHNASLVLAVNVFVLLYGKILPGRGTAMSTQRPVLPQ